MKTRIVRISNSQGIRIPKSFFQRSKLTKEVELEAFDGYIVICSTGIKPRAGWEEAFRVVADREKMSRSTQRSLRDCETRASQRQRRNVTAWAIGPGGTS